MNEQIKSVRDLASEEFDTRTLLRNAVDQASATTRISSSSTSIRITTRPSRLRKSRNTWTTR
jgi:hypothetical protein